MFLPLKDENPTRRVAFLTIGLIAANTAVFFLTVLSPRGLQAVVLRYGAIPEAIVHLVAPLTILTSMFLHGSLFHLAGNMLYLWIFGNNIEDVLGPFRFIIFYLLCGLAAALTQIAARPGSQVPMIGASGAIAGILGAYLMLFPAARIRTFIFLIIYIQVVPIPAAVVLGLWFVAQILNIGMGGGVAWFAHVGGFLTGMALVRLFLPRPRPA
jgi:membrane associated rhomboid family serine protease